MPDQQPTETRQTTEQTNQTIGRFGRDIGLAALDAALFFLSGLSLVLLNRWLTGFQRVPILWIGIAAVACTLILTVLEAAAAQCGDKPKFAPIARAYVARLRPSEPGWSGSLAFVFRFLWILAASALFGGLLEAAQTIWQLGHPDGVAAWRPAWFGWEATLAAMVLVIDRIWMRVHAHSIVWAHQLVDWNGLSDWTGRQKWVTTAALSFVVLLYAAIILPELSVGWEQKLRDKVHLEFLGTTYMLPAICFIEATGFLIGIATTAIFSMVSPYAFRRTGASVQDALMRTMRQCGGEAVGPHFYGTFKLYQEVLAGRPDLGTFDWTRVNASMKMLEKQRTPMRQAREAAFVVLALPPDDIVLRALLETFFLHVRPTWRFLLFVLLMIAEAMTLFPILARVLVFYLPRLAEAPSTWPIWNFWVE